ncbi:MAG: hypothetical protein FJZ97_01025 [Chloroflexi bacterium]|nr:hypothetical protein [Chloroflexota bacterium]
MEALSYRVLRNQPGRLEQSLGKQGLVLITKGGEPFALMVGLAEETLEDTVKLVAQVRAQQAVASMRAQARARGLDLLTDKQIRAEIEAARRAR